MEPTNTATVQFTVTVTPPTNLLPVTPGRIAFIDFSHSRLMIMNSDGSNAETITDNVNGPLAWSPDGQMIAFILKTDRNATKNELYVVRKDGSGLRRLTYAPHWKWSPSWSPDGQTIIFIDAGSDGNQGDIVSVNVEKGSFLKLTYTPGIEEFPIWSPNGEKIAFLYRETRTSSDELYVMDADGSNRIRISELPTNFSQMSWSPDSSQIAFSSDFQDCGEIYVTNLYGGGLRRLTDTPGCAYNPTWSPDGRYIAFNGSKKECCNVMDMGWEIYIMKADGSGVTQLTTNSDWIPSDPSWAPVPSLAIGDEYLITDAGGNLNLRESPSLDGTILAKLQAGERVTILEGPVEADHYYWWKIRREEEGLIGWAVELAGWFSFFPPTPSLSEEITPSVCKLLTTQEVSQFHWSEDGSRIYYLPEKNRTTWCEYDFNNGGSIPVDEQKSELDRTKDEYEEREWIAENQFEIDDYSDIFIAPDERTILYSQWDGKVNRIFQKSFEDKESQYIGVVQGVIAEGFWFDDQEKILVSIDWQSPVYIPEAFGYVIDLKEDQIKPVNLSVGEYPNTSIIGLTPDEQWVMFVSYSGEDRFVRLLNLMTNEVVITKIWNQPIDFQLDEDANKVNIVGYVDDEGEMYLYQYDFTKNDFSWIRDEPIPVYFREIRISPVGLRIGYLAEDQILYLLDCE